MAYGKKQQCTFEDRCETVLTENIKSLLNQATEVKTRMKELKKEILDDDERFEDDVKRGKVNEMIRNKHGEQLVMFHKQRMKQLAIEEQYRQKSLRHAQYDQLLFMVFRYWSSKVVELLFTSKAKFNAIFSSKSPPQFEVSVCFGQDGILGSEPTMEEHADAFEKVFNDMEKEIFKNSDLQFFVHDMNDLFFGKSSIYTRNIFENMLKVKKANKDYSRHHKEIFTLLKQDIGRC
jgi:hypothetical protein